MDTQSPDQSTSSAVHVGGSDRSKKWTWLFVTLAVVAALAVAFYLLRNQDTVGTETDNSAQVVISDTTFSPATINVKKGESITWVNQGEQPHRVVADTNKNVEALDSQEPLATGESYTYTFEEAGTFTYYDQLAPLELKGTIIVEED